MIMHAFANIEPLYKEAASRGLGKESVDRMVHIWFRDERIVNSPHSLGELIEEVLCRSPPVSLASKMPCA